MFLISAKLIKDWATSTLTQTTSREFADAYCAPQTFPSVARLLEITSTSHDRSSVSLREIFLRSVVQRQMLL
ncbi:hypothetical protein ACROYT_G017404 [Oculina patagonica]